MLKAFALVAFVTVLCVDLLREVVRSEPRPALVLRALMVVACAYLLQGITL